MVFWFFFCLGYFLRVNFQKLELLGQRALTIFNHLKTLLIIFQKCSNKFAFLQTTYGLYKYPFHQRFKKSEGNRRVYSLFQYRIFLCFYTLYIKVNDLRKELESRTLSSKGLKSQLIARLTKQLKLEEQKEEQKELEKSEKEDEEEEDRKSEDDKEVYTKLFKYTHYPTLLWSDSYLMLFLCVDALLAPFGFYCLVIGQLICPGSL